MFKSVFLVASLCSVSQSASAQDRFVREASPEEVQKHCSNIFFNDPGVVLLHPFNSNAFEILYCNTSHGPTVYPHDCKTLEDLIDRHIHDYPYGLTNNDSFTMKDAARSRETILKQFSPALDTCIARPLLG